jgi:multidrug resistance efflux pump
VAEREETARAIRSLQSRILKEQRRINRLRHTVIRANVTGQIWEILASAGEHVHSGQDLLRILNCNSVIVTASVRENVYNDLGLGDTAWFRLNGMTLVFEGTVSRLAGQSASAVYSNLAVAPTDRHLERFDVKLHVPSLADHPEYGCAVGKTGRVFFTRRPLDGLRDTLSSLWS